MQLLEQVHPNVRRVLEAYGIKKLAFLREVTILCGCEDDEAIMYLSPWFTPPWMGPACEGSDEQKTSSRGEDQ